MRKPIIAVTGDYDPQSHQYYIKEEYIQAISLAGGLPVVLYPSIEVPKEWSGDRQAWIEQYPLDERILEMADGILFTGGDDVDPAFYGSEVLCVNGEIIPQRDAFEIKLAREAIGWKIPSLGLCRGIQLMAVSAGAKLCQDILKSKPTGSIRKKPLLGMPRIACRQSREAGFGACWEKRYMLIAFTIRP